jgi:hypothetical protein
VVADNVVDFHGVDLTKGRGRDSKLNFCFPSGVDCSLKAIVDGFAEALCAIDGSRVPHKSFKPGVGPYGEGEAIRLALEHMRSQSPGLFSAARIKRLPDVLIPGQWALEFKIVRPFGDNGLPAEHWSENILHPYPGNTSSLGDCMKLLQSGLPERKGIIVFGYEHAQAVVPLDPAIRSFELLAAQVMQVKLSARIERRIEGLIHPIHEVLRVFGWEIFSTTQAS